MQQSKPSRSCVFVLQCLRFRVLKLCAICFIKLSSSFLNNGRLCPTRLAAMPRRPVTHAASDLEALAAQSASDYEEALRGKAGEESTCVTCRRAAFELARTHCVFVMNIRAARYEGSAEQMEHFMKKRMRLFWQTSCSHGPSDVGARRLATNPRCAATMRGNEGCLGLGPPAAPKRNCTRSRRTVRQGTRPPCASESGARMSSSNASAPCQR